MKRRPQTRQLTVGRRRATLTYWGEGNSQMDIIIEGTSLPEVLAKCLVHVSREFGGDETNPRHPVPAWACHLLAYLLSDIL